eukprot:1452069-Karenia_brevis.AAC.1
MKFLRTWAGLRADGIQSTMPNLMRLIPTDLVAQLDRTETSGPGGKIRWMTVYVDSGGSLTNSAWLRTR